MSSYNGSIFPGPKSYASKFGAPGQVITCEVDMDDGMINFKKGDEDLGVIGADKLMEGTWYPTVVLQNNNIMLSVFDPSAPVIPQVECVPHAFKFNPNQKNDGVKILPSLLEVEAIKDSGWKAVQGNKAIPKLGKHSFQIRLDRNTSHGIAIGVC